MKITNTLSVKMNWDSFTFPIKVGTPVSTAGVLANDADAVGIVPRTVKQKPDAGDELYLMTGGSIYLSEVAYTDLSVAAMQELDGIDFYKANGHVQQKGGSGGGLTPEQEALIQNAQWKTEGTPTTLFTETVTTSEVEYYESPMANFTYSGQITADYIVVTFDGVEYVCQSSGNGYTNYYGATEDSSTYEYDFSKYPFQIASGGDGYNSIITELPGSHSVSVKTPDVTFNEYLSIAVAENIPAATENKIGGVKKAEVNVFVNNSDETNVTGNQLCALLNALQDAGIIFWSTIG